MKTRAFALLLIMLVAVVGYSQTGHIMQGVGAVNMSMGGAATAQPVDIGGALQWNPAALSAFSNKVLSINAGAFFSSPELSSSLPAGMMGPGSPAVSGTTKDNRGVSVMPAVGMVWANENSKHTFGVSAFGVSGFGVTFPLERNNPMSPDFNPEQSSNPINYPQEAGGFGYLQSDYMLLQVGIAYAYKLSPKVSVGLQPVFNYAALELIPNPLASPDPDRGYPQTNNASAIGFGAQVGVFFDSQTGFKLGASYKSPQYFNDFEFENTYLDGGTAAGNNFRMDYPGILSVGTGYSTESFDLALDVRQVFYSSTEGFKDEGWTETASVKGFGWKDITVMSFGLQFKGVERLPVRAGYTYSTNPIKEELAFFSTPATAIIKHAVQLGLGYEFSDRVTLNGLFHFGTSAGSTEGLLLSPMAVGAGNPYGALPGTSVSYKMTTAMVMVGLNYSFGK
jgi:long-chain fatty acid transport protein